MNLNLYCSTQEQLAINLKKFVDNYFNNKISQNELIENTNELINLNKEKFYNKEQTSIALKIKQKVGKKRLNLILKILKQEVKF